MRSPSAISPPGPAPQDPVALYLDLLKRCLVNWIYPEAEVAGNDPFDAMRPKKPIHFVPEDRLVGLDWPCFAHTMIGMARLDNLQRCVQTIFEDGIPGDFLEAGAWRGGASIFLRGLLQAYREPDRSVWVADSFAGLPPPNAEEYPADAGDPHSTFEPLAVDLDAVKRNFSRYGLLDERVRFVKGWFKDTLPGLPCEQLALVRLDGDMYESTIQGLEALYPRLAVGGFMVIDDYGALANCRKAVEDFRAAEGIEDPLQEIDWTGAFWRRSR